ncbi:MAG: FAD-dependent monooxygenase [Gammaproteobacteria bacterium]|nr:FAD-dependent monooxygenase [Gammaproteobacteria bacterium]MDH5653659.1 FAD-dependent monooxygenase [Gammaproteobacteria bacterium]
MTSSKTNYDYDLIIIGSGIAGSGLACALAKHKLRILLLEKRRRLGTIHRGDSLVPKNTALLAQWGLFDALMEAGAVPIDQVEFHHQDRMLFHTKLTDGESSPYLVLPHAKTELLLQAQAMATGNVTLAQPATLKGLLRDTEDGPVRGIAYKDDTGDHEVTAPLTVGADGQQSALRNMLGIPFESYYYDHAYFGLEAERPASYQDAMRIQLHADGGVLLMPRPDRVGVGVLVEAGSASYWMGLSDDELSTILVERVPSLKGMKLFRDGSHVYTITRTHAPRYVTDGAVIIGDAAHTTNPTAGQGMALALSDAGSLAAHVGPLLEAGEEINTILKSYEQSQWNANQRLVRTSHWLSLLYGARGTVRHGMKMTVLKVLSNSLGSRIAKPVIENFMQA